MRRPTFHDLGIPFPLFEAPASEADEYRGQRRCSLCHKLGVHCFELGIGAEVVVHCPMCAVESALGAHDRVGRACEGCNAHLDFPNLGRGPVLACYACIRSGRATLTKNTEFGLIAHQEALQGVTQGVPDLDCPDIEMVPRDDDWIGVRLPTSMMLELLRTPGYSSIQGETWFFCCKAPMIYVGEWSRQKFSEMAPDGNGRAFFDSVVQDASGGLWDDTLGDTTGIYVFRCAACQKYKAHWDMF
jgi:uncharacterized protein CbrC (UPF0167 family)